MLAADSPFRSCLREPIPEIADAARYLDAAASVHLSGHPEVARELIRLADMPVIREWTESLWGKQSPFQKYRPVPGAPSHLPKPERAKERMPGSEVEFKLLKRDGFHCRFCGIPVIREEVRSHIKRLYPDALQWEPTNAGQHAAFQAMWVQYDHLLPHARGGESTMENMVITCAPCNYGRGDYTLEEVGLENPLRRAAVQSAWDGLERILKS